MRLPLQQTRGSQERHVMTRSQKPVFRFFQARSGEFGDRVDGNKRGETGEKTLDRTGRGTRAHSDRTQDARPLAALRRKRTQQSQGGGYRLALLVFTTNRGRSVPTLFSIPAELSVVTALDNHKLRARRQ